MTPTNFLDCLTAASPWQCEAACAPTLAMLEHSEKPKSIALSKGNFGYQAAINGGLGPSPAPLTFNGAAAFRPLTGTVAGLCVAGAALLLLSL